MSFLDHDLDISASYLNSLPKVLGMLTFGVFIVIHMSHYLSESQIGSPINHNTPCATLIQ